MDLTPSRLVFRRRAGGRSPCPPPPSPFTPSAQQIPLRLSLFGELVLSRYELARTVLIARFLSRSFIFMQSSFGALLSPPALLPLLATALATSARPTLDESLAALRLSAAPASEPLHSISPRRVVLIQLTLVLFILATMHVLRAFSPNATTEPGSALDLQPTAARTLPSASLGHQATFLLRFFCLSEDEKKREEAEGESVWQQEEEGRRRTARPSLPSRVLRHKTSWSV